MNSIGFAQLAKEPARDFARTSGVGLLVVTLVAIVYFSFSAVWHYYQPRLYKYLHPPITAFDIAVASFETVSYDSTVDLVFYAQVTRAEDTCGNRRETWYFDRPDGTSYVRAVFSDRLREGSLLSPGTYFLGPWRVPNVPFDATSHRGVVTYDCPGVAFPVHIPVGPWPLDLSGYSPW